MNKTVNINLAGIFFHIDEDAYAKLQHYLDTIKRSLTSTQGNEEIIADIEARIAELFSEKRKNERYVIGIREVEEVIGIMGQPEDYVLDEEIFEDEPSYKAPRTSKQLFRDTDNSYISGVSSGLGHYLGISAIWIRLIWILLSIFSSGGFILIYIALWIFIPEAKTTADKLAMRGEPVTVSNIERKIKEGFDDVTGRVKNVDYEKYGYRARKGADSAATAVGNVVSFLLNLLVKFIGILLLLFAGTVLIGLFIGLFSVGTFGIIEAPWTDYIEMAAIGAPLWLLSLLTFFAVGIPFFFLFILGLKILMRKLRTIGTTAKLVLLAVWLFSVIGLSVIGIQQATQRAFEGEVLVSENLPVTSNDTLTVEMRYHPNYSSFRDDVKISYDDQDRKIMVSHDVRLIVKSTKDSTGRIEVLKSADGRDLRDARTRAENIEYHMEFRNNRLILNSYLTSELENHWRNQEVQITLYLPVGSTLFADDNTYSFHRNSDWYGDILKNGDEEKYLFITEDGTECPDCPEEEFIEEETWENSSDEWEENDTTPEPETEWDKEENDTSSAGGSIDFSLNEEVASLRITAETTKSQLIGIARELSARKNIHIDFSGSGFREDGKIRNLSLVVDCNDGFSGEAMVSAFLLKKNDYGFSRNYQEKKNPFFIGKM